MTLFISFCLLARIGDGSKEKKEKRKKKAKKLHRCTSAITTSNRRAQPSQFIPMEKKNDATEANPVTLLPQPMLQKEETFNSLPSSSHVHKIPTRHKPLTLQYRHQIEIFHTQNSNPVGQLCFCRICLLQLSLLAKPLVAYSQS